MYYESKSPNSSENVEAWKNLQFDSEHGGNTDFYVQMVFQVQLNPVSL